MSKINLSKLAHSYVATPQSRDDFVLDGVNIEWRNGGAYALLGPSGCGKTTLLNIISGLLRPSEGQVLFDDKDVTALTPVERNIAQVFQFPVIYDTMTVYDNLAFPLRNRGVSASTIDTRVKEIAAMLDLSSTLRNRASGLTADGKQKISLGRGLVREDVNVIMFDEPLTVIDPHLKWELRSKLKEVHQQLERTMIYVTHDQTEALTFADQVVVMHEGTVVQVGTPVELFETPKHTFVGHFIGSPGMNILPCDVRANEAFFVNHAIELEHMPKHIPQRQNLELGVRPEFIRFGETGVPVEIVKVDDIGRYKIVETRHETHTIKLLAGESEQIPSNNGHLVFEPNRTRLYADGWLVE